MRRLLDDDDDDVDFSTTMVADEHCIADRASKSMKVVNLCIFIIERFFSGSAIDTVLYCIIRLQYFSNLFDNTIPNSETNSAKK